MNPTIPKQSHGSASKSPKSCGDKSKSSGEPRKKDSGLHNVPGNVKITRKLRR